MGPSFVINVDIFGLIGIAYAAGGSRLTRFLTRVGSPLYAVWLLVISYGVDCP